MLRPFEIVALTAPEQHKPFDFILELRPHSTLGQFSACCCHARNIQSEAPPCLWLDVLLDASCHSIRLSSHAKEQLSVLKVVVHTQLLSDPTCMQEMLIPWSRSPPA